MEDVGVPWFGDVDCCDRLVPRDVWLWDEEWEESFFFDDLLSLALDNCSCYLTNCQFRRNLSKGCTTCMVGVNGGDGQK